MYYFEKGHSLLITSHRSNVLICCCLSPQWSRGFSWRWSHILHVRHGEFVKSVLTVLIKTPTFFFSLSLCSHKKWYQSRVELFLPKYVLALPTVVMLVKVTYAFWLLTNCHLCLSPLGKQLFGQLSVYSCWASSRFPVGQEAARIDSCPLPPSVKPSKLTPFHPSLVVSFSFLCRSALMTCSSETTLWKPYIINRGQFKVTRA